MASSSASESPDAEEIAPSAAGEAVLEDRYRLLIGSRLPEFDLGGAEAVVVRDDRNPSDMLFARVCPPHVIPRFDIVNNLKHMREAKLLRPVEWGPVRWPGSTESRLAIVFDRPEHGPVLPPGSEHLPAMQTEVIRKSVLAPACLTLGFLAQRGLTHRGIRADNIYWDGAARTSTMLGDCVTFPPAAMQPTVYESIGSAMTPPLGRGKGSAKDDFYALGVTVLVLATGKLPLAGMPDEDIINLKLKRGSYAALMDGARPPFGLRELLRGLLSDNPEERWGLEHLEQWMGGGLRSAVQEARLGAVERPFEFAGMEFSNFRALAHAFGKNWKLVGKAIADPAFEKWLGRGAGDGPSAERVSQLLLLKRDADKIGPAQVTTACMLLDPAGPMRLKGLSIMPLAMGTVLADAFARDDRETIGLIGECITAGHAVQWYQMQSARDQIVYEGDIKDLRQMQQLLRHTGPGYGIERCLYMLNRNYPCQSRILRDQYVADVRMLLPALEKLVAQNGELDAIIDRHLTAFIASRIKANIDRLLSALEVAQGNAFMTKLGMLSLFAAVQAKHGPAHLPNLAGWLARELEPAVNRFHGKTLREQMKKRLEALAGGGNLVDLHNCLNSDSTLRRDEAARKKAMREFAAAGREIAQLESKEFHDSAQRLGWRLASAISGSIAFITAVVVVMA